MGRLGKKDPKLSEVKAVLRRLQGIGTEGDAAGEAQPGPSRRGAGSAVVVVSAVIALTAAGILGVALFVGFNEPTETAPGSRSTGAAPGTKPARPAAPTALETRPPVTAVPDSTGTDATQEPAFKAALEGARTLMAKGQVRAAREQLLLLADQGSPDAAWDLARSYDPNVLVALAGADAAPNVKEAERWYRAWYAAAVRDGLVADSVSLERIIGSMRR